MQIRVGLELADRPPLEDKVGEATANGKLRGGPTLRKHRAKILNCLIADCMEEQAKRDPKEAPNGIVAALLQMMFCNGAEQM